VVESLDETGPPYLSHNKTLQVVFLLHYMGFPHGMAASQRVRLLGKALIEEGADVTVLCTSVSERPSYVENIHSSGQYSGIRYEYTTGATVRSKSFLKRRIHEFLGFTRALIRLFQFKYSGRIDVLYLWTGLTDMKYKHFSYVLLARLLNIRIILEINERAWSMKDAPTFLDRVLSPIMGAHGAIVISYYLNKWATEEASRHKKIFAILQVPIIVDAFEQEPYKSNREDMYFLFAGSPLYDQTIRFILDSMMIVWRRFPSAMLVMTGCRPDDPATSWVVEELKKLSIESKVKIAGYVSREELMSLYARARGLLIPLFDDVRSKSRFPTKIGEYLSSSTPIVTNSVGDINLYFEDRKNAFLCEPGKPELYAHKIIHIIEYPDEAMNVGLRGRLLAEKNFHYSNYGKVLKKHFEHIL
jgi:glycosyltransferase involved in cell wall biosynthesis